jgi:hypothetical protein
MDAADHNEGVTEQAMRYVITRPCLAEGSLRLLKYLRPMFPEEGQVQLQDSRGEFFTVTVEAATGRLSGVGELYRAHNLGVNDVLHLRRAEERRYTVECVVKPHARTQPNSPERPTPAPVVAEKRVVIHATPHVREIRTERVTVQAAEPAPRRASEKQEASGRSMPVQAVTVQMANVQTVKVQAAKVQTAKVPPITVQAVQGRRSVGQEEAGQGNPDGGRPPASRSPETRPPGSRSVTPPGSPSGRPGQVKVSRRSQAGLTTGLATPIQFNFPAPTLPATPIAALLASPPTVADLAPGQPAAAQQSDARTAPSSTARAGTPPAPAPHPGPVHKAPVGAAHASRPLPAGSRTTEPSGPHNPEDQITALARLTGYACEHLGSGVVRLQADLGPHSYSVLIATTPQALTTPAWNETCDYMALLTPEDQRPQGIPRFTYAALEALLEHARLAPLTPIDLRGYWNTGSFDQESVESVAELVSAHLAQRGSFSHVLLTLAQQPAHSLVHLPRLAERLGSGVNTAELQTILETLSRPPFQALTPLPNGQFYLRNDVRDLLQEFSEYAEGMRRRIRPAPLAAAQR